MELGLTPDTRRPVDPADAAAAGFTTLGLVAGQATPSPLPCHELLGLQVGPDLAAADAMAERLADEAATTGASWVLTTFQVEPPPEVARWAAMFEAAGSGLAVEFTPLGPVATIADGLAALERAGSGRLVVDAWNFCLGPSTWADLEHLPLDAIAYVQFTDALAPLGPIDLQEAMTRRALPGDGVLELDRFVATLRDRGWDGVVSMQVLSDELRALPVDEHLRRVHDAGRRAWD